jgi:recombination protein RecR
MTKLAQVLIRTIVSLRNIWYNTLIPYRFPMLPQSFQVLIRHLSSLPSIGPKMAERLTLHLFKQSQEDLHAFADAISSLASLSSCVCCHNVSEGEFCPVCANPKRDIGILCVVEDALDAIAIERSGMFSGRYHILGGVMDVGRNGNSNESDLTIGHLLSRVRDETISEVILATNPTTEGDLTALYIRRQLSRFPHIRVSRIARGLATGGDIEYADDQTLAGALRNRSAYETLQKETPRSK